MPTASKRKLASIELQPNPRNPRLPFSPEQKSAFAKSVREFGDIGCLTANRRSNQMVSGHKRADELDYQKVVAGAKLTWLPKATVTGTVAYGHATIDGEQWALRIVDWPPEKEAAANLAANQFGAEFDWSGVAGMLRDLEGKLDFKLTGFSELEIKNLLATGLPAITEQEARATLAERFGVPPFSVLDARQGYWQDRKRAWLALGIKSEIGRGSTPSTSARAAEGDIPTYRHTDKSATRQRGNAATVNQSAMKKIQKSKPASRPAEARVPPAITPDNDAVTVLAGQ